MGGVGSGRWIRWERRVAVEDVRSVDVRQWHRAGLLREGLGFLQSWSGRYPKQSATVAVHVERDHVTLRYSWSDEYEDSQSVQLDWTSCNYGGQRPWFLCPGAQDGIACGRRVVLLYAAGRYFLCRHCYRLPYRSTLETEEDRLLRRANKIRTKLGGKPGALNPFPPKPKWMHYGTFCRLSMAEPVNASETLLGIN